MKTYHHPACRRAPPGGGLDLARAGISDDRIAQVMAEGLEAKETRLVIEHGEVKDAIEFLDWHARHKFVTAAMQAKGYLIKEDKAAPGGLIVIDPTQINLVPGHSPTCQCDACCEAWTERARRNIAQHARKEAITVDHATVAPETPKKIKSPEEKLADWEDD